MLLPPCLHTQVTYADTPFAYAMRCFRFSPFFMPATPLYIDAAAIDYCPIRRFRCRFAMPCRQPLLRYAIYATPPAPMMIRHVTLLAAAASAISRHAIAAMLLRYAVAVAMLMAMPLAAAGTCRLLLRFRHYDADAAGGYAASAYAAAIRRCRIHAMPFCHDARRCHY